MFQCCSTIYDTGLSLNQHRLNVQSSMCVDAVHMDFCVKPKELNNKLLVSITF